VTTAHAPQAGGFVRAWRKFSRWRKGRPFWGGLLLLLSGLELFLSGNMNLGALQVHFGPTGFLSYVIPAMLLLCGVMTWATPNLRLFYGVLGSLVAVYSLIGLNFGGFLLGLLLGIIGGALTIAWTPVNPASKAPAAEPVAVHEAPPPAPAAQEEEASEAAWFLNEHSNQPAGHPDERPRYDHGQPYEDVPAYGNGQGYGRPSDAQTEEFPREVQNPERWWGNGESNTGHGADEPPHGGASGGYRTRMFAITLVPVTLAAVALMAVDRAAPAYALPCPNPSASTATSPKATPKTAPKPAAPKPQAPANGAPAANGAEKAPQQTEPSATPTASATSTGTGNPFVDGWNDFVDGVKKFFGGDDTATPGPTPSASASPSTGTGGTGNAGNSGSGSAPAKPGADPAQPPPADQGSPTASPSTSTVPCLGPGVIKSAAVGPGQPIAAATSGVITGQSLTMYGSSYDGVVDLPTKTGTIRALKFTMVMAVTEPFQLTVREPNGKNTVITSPKLTICSTDLDPSTPAADVDKKCDLFGKRTVEFYTPKFSGKLFGLIPVTFTPDSPPPLTLPILTFNDVTIDLAFVKSNALGAPDLHIDEE
jgi:hypothetical protein